MTAEGAVTVRLTTADGRVAGAAVSIRRPQAARALLGRTPEEAVRLIPALFSLCGTAQAVAALSACEAVLEIDAAAHLPARRLLVLAEMAAMHGWQATMDWPVLLGEPQAPGALVSLRTAAADLGKALYTTGDGLRPGGGTAIPDLARTGDAVARMSDWFGRHLFAGPAPGTGSDLAAWAEDGATPAARLAARMLGPQFAGFGASPVEPLRMTRAGWFARRMVEAADFGTLPRTESGPAFTGPLARRLAHPLVAPLVEIYGTGLAAHLAARLADIAELCRALATGGEAVAEGIAEGAAGGRSGCAVIETVRGRLAHWLRLDEAGRIADYRIVAPTEWNFAPDGILARGLEGVPAGPDLERRVRHLVALLDPCVPCAIDLSPEE